MKLIAIPVLATRKYAASDRDGIVRRPWSAGRNTA
jgi:hypothetical protein